MPVGAPKTGKRERNPEGKSSFKCTLCKSIILWKNRLEHARIHENSVDCTVSGCKGRYKNVFKAKKQHFVRAHMAQCAANEWVFKESKMCDLLLENCHLCKALVAAEKPRFSSNRPYTLNRHKLRAASKIDESKRSVCQVLDVATGVRCGQTFADKENLRKHLCGRDGVTTQRSHSLKDIKLAYPAIGKLMTRKADKHRTLGKIHRSFTNSQKERSNKKRPLQQNNNMQMNSGKKARADQKNKWFTLRAKITAESAKRSDRSNDRRDRCRLPGAGHTLSPPIADHQKLLLNIANEMTSQFENLAYEDIARNFNIELEFQDPPFHWVVDPDDEDRDRYLKARRVQYYFTKHTGPEKPSVWRVRQPSSASPQTYLDKCRSIFL